MILKGANILMGGIEGNIDGHAHVFDISLPLDKERRYTPVNNAPLPNFLTFLRGGDLDGAILVQPSFLGTNNAFLLKALSSLSDEGGVKIRGVAMLTPDISADDILELHRAGIIGLRFNLLGKNPVSAFRLDAWKRVIGLVNDLGWHVELHCEGQELAKLLPPLLNVADRVVVDHFGLPDPRSPLNCSGQESLINAPKGRVFVKISAPYRVFPECSTKVAVRLCSPIFKALYEHMGPEYLMWGSDWPWTQFENCHSYADTLNWRSFWLES